MGKWYLVNQVKGYLRRLIESEISSKCYSAEQMVGEMMLEFDFHVSTENGLSYITILIALLGNGWSWLA